MGGVQDPNEFDGERRDVGPGKRAAGGFPQASERPRGGGEESRLRTPKKGYWLEKGRWQTPRSGRSKMLYHGWKSVNGEGISCNGEKFEGRQVGRLQLAAGLVPPSSPPREPSRQGSKSRGIFGSLLVTGVLLRSEKKGDGSQPSFAVIAESRRLGETGCQIVENGSSCEDPPKNALA